MGSSQSGPKITAQDRAVLDLKLQRDKVKQYQKKLEVVLDREQELARLALQQGRKDRALTALRRRKYQSSLLVKTDAQLETLENLVSSIEFSLVEKDVLFGLKQGNAVLKEIHKEMNVESVERLMQDTQEAVAYQREIDEVLTSTMTLDEEEAVQKELAALQAETVGVPTVPPVELPSAPTTEPVAQPTEEVPEEAREHAAERQPERRVALEA